MASEYYKWLARDVKPEEQKELTRAEKRRNWWDYHKWHVVIAIVCLLLLGDFVLDIVQNHLNTPDYYIAYVGETQLPDDTVTAIEEAFAALGEDITGNGKVQVELMQYSYSTAEPTGDFLTEQDYSAAYTGTVQLMADLQTGQSVLFLLEDPEAFQTNYEILARVDGTLPEDTPDSAVPVALRWSDCPVLSGLELGNFQLDGLLSPVGGSSDVLMANMWIARRGFWNNESSPEIDGAAKLFDLLTEGAK